MPRGNLSSSARSAGLSRRQRTRERFQSHVVSKPAGLVKPQKATVPSVNSTPVVPCPVCLHDSPGVLENHLRNYHKLGDMRDALRTLLGRELPRQLSQLISTGEVGAVSRVLANFAMTGLLQVPTVTLPSRTTTRVLWRATP